MAIIVRHSVDKPGDLHIEGDLGSGVLVPADQADYLLIELVKAQRRLQDAKDQAHKGDVKKPLTGLFRDQPGTPEGKYLVKRRDGTVPPWPSFVLGAADPMVPATMRFYATWGFILRHFNWSLLKALWRYAGLMNRWRKENHTGDPGMGKHRKDDPATVAEMRKGWSA